MPTSPGSRLGPYEIVSRIGAGGMGEVFRARDTRLDRSVAIKVLPAAFAANAQLKLRFEREAKTISQLNHPNICTLYDVGDDYLVMELLEGETVAERLAKGPMPLADVLKTGAQIADALDRAHRAGIVHRDLKPANVMLTKSGAKLLDFGLAKSSVQQVNPDGVTLQHDKSLTQEGTILGTFQYMAPEQLEAEEADARTDIFALGAVLYEMATGKRAFEGKTKTSLIAAIVAAQPQPVSQLMPLSPPALDHVIQKCLEKEREDRWQSAHDVAEELKWIGSVSSEQRMTRAPSAKVAIAAAIVLALALAGVTAMWLRARNAPQARVAFAVMPPKGYSSTVASLSPDGSAIAFVATRLDQGGIYVRRVDQIEAKQLTSNPDDHIVAWSPDSKWIAYVEDRQGARQLKKIAADGGTPETIARLDRGISVAAWAPDGTFLFSRVFGEGLFSLHPDRPDPVEVTKLDSARRESVHTGPRFLADGKRFLYLSHTIAERKNEIWAGSLDGKLRKMIVRADSLAGVTASRIYFVNDGALYEQGFDQDDLALRAQPRRLVERVFFSEAGINARADVSDNGALLYQPTSSRTVDLSWYDRNGRRIEKVLAEPDLVPLSLSHDGTRIAAEKWDHVKGANDIYVIDLVRGVRTRLTSGLSNHQEPMWSPDDSRIYFISDRDGPFDVYAQADDGATPAVPVWKSVHDKAVTDISPDGRYFLGNEAGGTTKGDIWLVPVDAPDKRRALVATDANETGAGFTPDGKWIIYRSDQSGRHELYVRRIDGGRSIQISTGGAIGYAMRVDGTEIYVRTPNNERMVVPITYQGDRVIPGTATPLFSPPALDYAMIAATDKGFLMRAFYDPSDYITVLHYVSAPER